MTKTKLLRVTIFIGLFCSSLPSICQGRFDIHLEGPWILYERPGFFTDGKLALVAIAPKADNHDEPIFSTGNGAKFPSLGIYCLGYLNGDNFSCSSNAAGPLTYKPDYPDPQPVEPKLPSGWDYAALGSSSYIIILPMPDTYSADGQYGFTFENTFPTPNTPPPDYLVGSRAIGAFLHYAQGGPAAFQLLKCVGMPSVANCHTKAISDDQFNSGTLRIDIKNIEDSNDVCDYHVRGAYHKMIGMLDPAVTNKNIAYISATKYDACAKCDPQSTPAMNCPKMPSTPSPVQPLDISRDLLKVVEALKAFSLPEGEKGPAQLNELSLLSGVLDEKSPTLSRLLELESYLSKSEEFLLRHKGNAGKFATKQDFLRVEGNEILLSTASAKLRSSTSGKDCRVALMHVVK